MVDKVRVWQRCPEEISRYTAVFSTTAIAKLLINMLWLRLLAVRGLLLLIPSLAEGFWVGPFCSRNRIFAFFIVSDRPLCKSFVAVQTSLEPLGDYQGQWIVPTFRMTTLGNFEPVNKAITLTCSVLLPYKSLMFRSWVAISCVSSLLL